MLMSLEFFFLIHDEQTNHNRINQNQIKYIN